MLTIKIQGTENWDSSREEFVYTRPVVLSLEHSLVSVSKWEAKWGRSFFDKPPATRIEQLDYIRCMTMTQNVPSEVYSAMTARELSLIEKYIAAPMTATTIKTPKQYGGRGQTITSELIYYWMIEFGIPFECQKWHLNRLMTLIRICEIKSRPAKKKGLADIMRDNTALNKQRRAMLNSKG